MAVLGVAVLGICGSGQLTAQSFTNLDFDSGSLPQSYPWDASKVLPGWDVFCDCEEFLGFGFFPGLVINSSCVGSPCIAIHSGEGENGRPPIQGKFSINLDSAASRETGIRQTGVIPGDSKTLTFRADVWGGAISVRLDGKRVPVVPLQRNNTHTVYGVDVRHRSGRLTTMSFAGVGWDRVRGFFGNPYIDDIRFVGTEIGWVDLQPNIELPTFRDEDVICDFVGVLQVATSSAGPFVDLPEAVSPFTQWSGKGNSARYFRARGYEASDF